MFSPYIITNLIDSSVYIGKTKTNNIAKRFVKHKQGARRGIKNVYLYNAIRKHGAENFCITKLGIDDFDNERDCLDEEVRYIKSYRDLGYNVYNMTDGGEGISGFKHSDETKAKMSAKLSVSKIGNTNWLGKKHSEQAIANMRLAQKQTRIPVIAIDKQGNSTYYESITSCSKALNAGESNISRCLQGRYKTAKSHTFRYAEVK